MMAELDAALPGWLPALLRDRFGVDVPSHDEVELAPSWLTQVAPTVPPSDSCWSSAGPRRRTLR